jgi:hypothetical protein
VIAIRMARGTAYVSDEDACLAQHCWRLCGAGYAARGVGTRITRGNVYLHRVVAERAGLEIQGVHVDHIDGDRLNNTRGNLV